MSDALLPLPHLGPQARRLLDRIVAAGQRGVFRTQIAEWVLHRLLQLGYVTEHPLDSATLVHTLAGMQRWQFEAMSDERRAAEKLRKEIIRQRVQAHIAGHAAARSGLPAVRSGLPALRPGSDAVRLPPYAGQSGLPALYRGEPGRALVPVNTVVALPMAAQVEAPRSSRRGNAGTIAVALLAATSLAVLLLSGFDPPDPWPLFRQAPDATASPVSAPAAPNPAAQATLAAPVPQVEPVRALAEPAHLAHAVPEGADAKLLPIAAPVTRARQAPKAAPVAPPLRPPAVEQAAALASVPSKRNLPVDGGSRAATPKPAGQPHPSQASRSPEPADESPAPKAEHTAALAAAAVVASVAASSAAESRQRVRPIATQPVPAAAQSAPAPVAEQTASAASASTASTPAPDLRLAANQPADAAPGTGGDRLAPSLTPSERSPRPDSAKADAAGAEVAAGKAAPQPVAAAPKPVSAAAEPVPALVAAAKPATVPDHRAAATPRLAAVDAQKPRARTTPIHDTGTKQALADAGPGGKQHPAVARSAAHRPRKLSGHAEVELLNRESLEAARRGHVWRPAK